jgi:hypothetical protein
MGQGEDLWGKATLTARQAFMVMHCFLERYYQATHADEIGGLLGSLSLLPDGSPADYGFRREWLDAVRTVIAAEKASGYQQADLRFHNEHE